MKCYFCNEPGPFAIYPAMTAYHHELCNHDDCLIVPEMRALCYESRDPNKPIIMCADCANDYHDHWKERWDEYYSNLI